MGTVFFNVRFEPLPVPVTISGLVTWLDGEDPAATGVKPTNGTAVSSWVDKSGSGMITSFTQATVGNRPIYASSALNSKGGVSFNGTNFHSMSTSLSTANLDFGSNSITMFFVLTGITGGVLFYRGNGTWSQPEKKLWFGDGTGFEDRSGLRPALVGVNQNYAIGASNIQDPVIFTMAMQTTAPRITYYRNSWNTSDSLSDNSWNPFSDSTISNLFLGYGSGNNNLNLTGTICEVLIYNKVLSQSERTTITNYLSQKYDILLTVDYPPAALTSGMTNIIGQPYGNGSYLAIGSSVYQNNVQYQFFRAFNKDNGVSFWHGDYLNYNTSSPYAWNGGTLATTPGVGNGEYVELLIPTAITVVSYQITTRSDFNLGYTYAPTVFALAGSNDGSTWTVVDSESGVVWAANGSKTFRVSSPSAYSRYRLVVLNCNGNGYTSIGELIFYAN